MPAREEIVLQGEPGDHFYILAEGEVEVSRAGCSLASLGSGDFFGEIALLRDVPRSATVTASTDVWLYALEREDYLEIISGRPRSTAAADAVTKVRLADQ